MAKLLGIDIGTTATKAVLIDESGRVLKQASSGYPLHTPHPNWAEQDPLDWKRAVGLCLEEIGERSPDAIGLTGQMHGMVALGTDDEILNPAILWCDQRTEKECEEIDRLVGSARVREITGNPPLTGFQLPKVLWLKNNRPDDFAQLKSVLLPKDYIRFVLTGEKATDVSDGSGVGMLDLRTRGWSSEMEDELLPGSDFFPGVFESGAVTGTTKGFEHLDDGIPVVAGGGDQAAGAVGTGAVAPGVVSVSLGTSGVVFASLDSPEPDPTGSAHVFCHANGAWHAMGVMLSCGGAVQWAKDTLYSKESFQEFDADAAAVAAGCEGLTFLPYLTGERCPHNDPSARGAFAGLTLSHGRGHLARAVIEGATFGLAGCLDLIRNLGVDPQEIRVTGGGAKSDLWMQMLADVFGVPCVRVAGDEGPAFGAAVLAGVGIDTWSDVKVACEKTVKLGMCFEPSGTDYTVPLARYQKLYPTLKVWQ